MRDTRFYVLRLIGRSTNPFIAAALSFCLSVFAGFAEEILFRGVILSGLTIVAGFPVALIMSSALFGSGDRYSMCEILSCRLFLHVAIYFKVGTKAHLLHRQKEKCILLRRIIRTLHMRT